MNISSQMLERKTMKEVDKNFTEPENKIRLKDIAFEIVIYVTRKNLRGGLHYVR